MENLTVDLKNLSESERATLTELIKKANKPKVEKVFKPEYNSSYYLVGGDDVYRCTCRNGSFDNFRLSLGNVYREQEDAELALKRQQAKTTYINFLRENEPADWVCDWSDKNQNKCYLYYSNSGKGIIVGTVYYSQTLPIRFYSNKTTIELAMNTPEIALAWKCFTGINL